LKPAVFFLLLLSAVHTFAQRKQADSLIHLLHSDGMDTSRIKHLNQLALKLELKKIDTALVLSKQALALSRKGPDTEKGRLKGIGISCQQIGTFLIDKGNYTEARKFLDTANGIWNTILAAAPGNKSILELQSTSVYYTGMVYDIQGDLKTALEYYFKALEIARRSGNPRTQVSKLGNIGKVYIALGDYTRALDYMFRALRISDSLGDKQRKATQLSNIGIVFHTQGNPDKALDYYFKAIALAREISNNNLVRNNLGNIANIYDEQGKSDKALEYHSQALQMAEEMKDKHSIATNSGNIGLDYEKLNNYSKALEYLNKALDIDTELGEKENRASWIGGIGEVYAKSGKKAEAEKNLLHALALYDSIGVTNEKIPFEMALSDLYASMGNYQKALEHYRSSVTIRDTLFNREKNKEITRKEMNYEFDKKEAATRAEQERKDIQAADEKKRGRITLILLSALAIALSVVAVTVYRGLRQSKRASKMIEQQRDEISAQKETVERQKVMVEEHQKEIIDSITYAKRLQKAILPRRKDIHRLFPESFVVYKPKDIVAGDFYWMEKVGDNIFIAAADSTGHGVPGALVSVVCSNALNRAVNEFNLTHTGLILDKAREIVLDTFAKSGEEIQDGMDISMACIPIGETGKFTVQWSGANNPLWYWSNGNLQDVTGDKQAIGKTMNPRPFTTHSLELKRGDILYLFTDGFADQFGGPKGKKYKYKQLQDNLVACSVLPMASQKAKLESSFDNWKGDLEQVDDVTLLGIRL
jgi:tetratricopeptide (TPR) repeat protein